MTSTPVCLGEEINLGSNWKGRRDLLGAAVFQAFQAGIYVEWSLRFVPIQEGGRKGSTHLSATYSTSSAFMAFGLTRSVVVISCTSRWEWEYRESEGLDQGLFYSANVAQAAWYLRVLRLSLRESHRCGLGWAHESVVN